MDDFSNLTVIIPTLNEEENVPKLVVLLSKRYKGIKIIVADDGSADGTKRVVENLAKRNRNIRFLDRKNKSVHGLTASVLDAAMRVNTSKIALMDGDMQHPFEKISEISKALDRMDLVIGVRTHVKNWGFQRRIISKGMNLLVYVVFKLRGKPVCDDMMSGFFGIRTSLFKSLISRNRKAYVEKGYKVMLDTLRVIGRNARIGEVKYSTFHDRLHGKSKLGMHQVPTTLESTFR